MCRLVFERSAQRQLGKLDPYAQKRIRTYLDKNVDGAEDPRAHGKMLSESLSEYWRYRVGDYRVVCRIRDDVCEVVAVRVGHRSRIYST
jgi:mRNA interferase RelE/StbE